MIIEGYVFLFLIEIICCDPSSEPSRRDGSDGRSQLMFCAESTEIVPKLSPNTPSTLIYSFLCRIDRNYPKLSSNTPTILI